MNQRAKQTGEVFTPRSLIREMLDKLPNSVWFDPNKTWLEPAAGDGNFLVEIKARLLQAGHKEKHILDHMLFSIELIDDNHWVLQHRLGYLVDGKPNPKFWSNRENFSEAKIHPTSQDLNGRNPYHELAGLKRDEVLYHRNHVCTSALEYDMMFGRKSGEVPPKLKLLPERNLGPWPDTDTPDVGEKYLVEQVLGSIIVPSQHRTAAENKIAQIPRYDLVISELSSHTPVVYLNFMDIWFGENVSRICGVGKSEGVHARHNSKVRDIRTAGGKSTEPHHKLSDRLVEDGVTGWRFLTHVIGEVPKPYLSYVERVVNKALKEAGIETFTSPGDVNLADVPDSAILLIEKALKICFQPIPPWDPPAKKIRTIAKNAGTPKDGKPVRWTIWPSKIGQGIKLERIDSNGIKWVGDHDALVRVVKSGFKGSDWDRYVKTGYNGAGLKGGETVWTRVG